MIHNKPRFALKAVGALAILAGILLLGYTLVRPGLCDTYLVASIPVETVPATAETMYYAELTNEQQAIVRASLDHAFTAADPVGAGLALEGQYVEYEGTTYAFELTYRACGDLVWAYQLLGGVLAAVGGSYLYLSERV